MPIETVHDVVAEARASFTLGTRADGSEFWHTTDDAPEWVSEMVYAAHGFGEMMPDDHVYKFVVQALDALDDAAENLDAGNPWDYLPEPVYTAEVTGWLASHAARAEYVDTAAREYGTESDPIGIIERLTAGYCYERSEVVSLVMSQIQDRATSLGIEE